MAKKAAVSSVLVLLVLLFNVTMGTQVYRVGDYIGWNNSNKVNYTNWSASKTFIVGDVLMFQFNPSDDNVFRVSAEDFAACHAPSPIGLPSDGQEFYSLNRPGRWYFLCSIPGRCEAGQKLEILVHSVASAPASQTTPSQPSSPAPAPAPSAMPSQSSQMPPLTPSPSQNNRTSASSPAASPDHSPAKEKSGSVAALVNFWVAMLAVAFCVFHC